MDYRFKNEDVPTMNRIHTYAVPYSDMAMYTPVINELQFDDVLWIKMLNVRPHDVTVDYLLNNDTGEEIELCEYTYFRNMKSPWIRLTTDVLDCEVGMHTYKLILKDDKTEDKVYLYFSYTVQDDNVDKPYVYMKR